MSILGVESVEFGVDDLDTCTRFWGDLGLTELSRDTRRGEFEVLSGSRVVVLGGEDSTLPPRNFAGNGVRRTMWGVDTQANLDKLVKHIESDTKVTRGDDGAAFFQAPDGQHLGLRAELGDQAGGGVERIFVHAATFSAAIALGLLNKG